MQDIVRVGEGALFVGDRTTVHLNLEDSCHAHLTIGSTQRVKHLQFQPKEKKITAFLSPLLAMYPAWLEAQIWPLWCCSTNSAGQRTRPGTIWTAARAHPWSVDGASHVSVLASDNRGWACSGLAGSLLLEKGYKPGPCSRSVVLLSRGCNYVELVSEMKQSWC